MSQAGQAVEMENFFSRLTLDIIGKAVFNYDFDSLTHDDPVIQARSLLSITMWRKTTPHLLLQHVPYTDNFDPL